MINEAAKQAAAGLAFTLAAHAPLLRSGLMETMAGGTAFVVEHDGHLITVIITPQTADGPLMAAPDARHASANAASGLDTWDF